MEQHSTEPVNRSKGAARRMYDRISRWYDPLAGSSERPYKQRTLQLLDSQPGETVLEIGTGTGECALALARSVGDTGAVHALDLSGGMLKVSARKAECKGAHLQLAQADGATLPYADACFDAVFSSFTLELFDTPELPRVLAECLRVLRPGGRLAIASMDQSERPGLMSRAYIWFHRRMPTLVDCRPIPVVTLIRAAGFAIEKVETATMWGLPVAMVLARKPA